MAFPGLTAPVCRRRSPAPSTPPWTLAVAGAGFDQRRIAAHRDSANSRRIPSAGVSDVPPPSTAPASVDARALRRRTRSRHRPDRTRAGTRSARRPARSDGPATRRAPSCCDSACACSRTDARTGCHRAGEARHPVDAHPDRRQPGHDVRVRRLHQVRRNGHRRRNPRRQRRPPVLRARRDPGGRRRRRHRHRFPRAVFAFWFSADTAPGSCQPPRSRRCCCRATSTPACGAP